MRKVALATLAAIAVLSGCVRFSGPDDVRRQLSLSAGVELQQEVGITVTRSGIWLAKKSLRWADEPDVSLDGLKRVEIGIYEVVGLRDSLAQPEPLGLELFPTDWTPWVRVQESGSEVFVMVRQDDNDPSEIRQMLVVVAERDEWIVVRMRGDLDRVLEDTLRFAFDQADRPELYDRTREERDLPPIGAAVATHNLASSVGLNAGD